MERRTTTRRSMLAGTGLALTSAVAGCLGQLTGDGGENDDGEANGGENGDESDPQSGGKHYEIQSTGDAEDSPLKHEVALVQPRIDSPEQPLTVEVTVTNTSSETVKYGERRSALGLFTRTGDFALYPPGEGAEFDAEAGLWSVPEPVGITMDFQVGELGPGEDVTQPLELIYVGDELPDSAPESLEYDLPYGVTTDGTNPESSDRSEWGFTLTAVE